MNRHIDNMNSKATGLTARTIQLLFLFALAPLSLSAKVALPALFSDGMVLQRHQPIPVWGWADAGEQVTVTLGRKSLVATADDKGCWRVDLPAMKAGGPYRLTAGDAVVSDVMVGDVWLCSGQSNVDTNIERVYPQYPDEIDADQNPMVRLFRVNNVPNLHGPQADVKATGWKPLSKDNAWTFSALGYFLGKRMQASTGVAQGIIQTSWGGTPIEAWLPVDSMMKYDPRGVLQTRLYQDEALLDQINRLNARSSTLWNQLLDQADPGIAGGWMQPAFDDSRWQRANQYQLPIANGPFCGTYWLRQHLHVDAAHAGKPALLLVGTLTDADITYVNGRQVGRTYYQYPPRRYQLPEGLLREGDNVITVRFINQYGRPAFWRDKPYQLVYSRDDVQPLAEEWLVSDGVQMPAQPSAPAGVQNMTSVLWNGMLAGLAPYALSGVVWYQGESNTGRAREYQALLSCLMSSWRQLFQQPRLPFVVVQLANYMQPSPKPQNSGWAQLRESQRRAVAADARAAPAVAIDLGEAVDIHPLRKKELAERCALAFDRQVFGKRVLLSPEVVSIERSADHLIVTFDQPLQPGSVQGFELADASGTFRTVAAQAVGSQVVIAATADGPSVGTARTIRYAWKDNPVEANVRGSKSALPATPFELTIGQ